MFLIVATQKITGDGATEKHRWNHCGSSEDLEELFVSQHRAWISSGNAASWAIFDVYRPHLKIIDVFFPSRPPFFGEVPASHGRVIWITSWLVAIDGQHL